MANLRWWKKACAVFVLCAATAIISPAQIFTTLVDFDGTDGANPAFMSLTQGSDGALIGTTSQGTVYGGGTAFRITALGLTTLYSFCTQTNCVDGDSPESRLIQADDGNLYGTTVAGGAYEGGTVFKIAAEGTITILYSFCAQTNCADGGQPYGGLVQGIDGSLYGTTFFGGANYSKCTMYGRGCGTVFKITPSGVLTTLHNFCAKTNCADGRLPYGALVQGTDGDFYGTTTFQGVDGSGTVFKITPSGKLTTLHSFGGGGDGQSPYAGLVEGTDGNFYGTTIGGGEYRAGTVFQMTASGTLTILHNFDGTDGGGPIGTLIQGNDGNFFGSTSGGGENDSGTIFAITPGGALSTLHIFTNVDGASPGGLLQATNGTFYGSTTNGGDLTCHAPVGCGTLFSLNLGFGAFVSFVRNPAKVGQAFGILGQGFTGTTSVSLSGSPASFTVVSPTLIRATVPAGATTGYVTVTTPRGTLTNNVPFHVIP